MSGPNSSAELPSERAGKGDFPVKLNISANIPRASFYVESCTVLL